MSSLHDKYFSDINKDYIYNLACKIIKEEYNINVSQDIYFKEIFSKNMVEAFSNTDTDNIAVVNRNLLELQLNSFNYSNKPILNDIIILNAMNRIKEENDSIYNFRISSPPGKYLLDKIILSKNNNSIFSHPLIIVNINKRDIISKLLTSYELNQRVFYEYEPIKKYEIILNDINNFILKDLVNTNIYKSGLLKVSSVNDNYIVVDNNDYKIGDILSINKNLVYIEDINDNKVFIKDLNDLDIIQGNTIINISESPVFIFTSL